MFCRAEVGKGETSLNEEGALGATNTLRADNSKDSEKTNRLQVVEVVNVTP